MDDGGTCSSYNIYMEFNKEDKVALIKTAINLCYLEACKVGIDSIQSK